MTATRCAFIVSLLLMETVPHHHTHVHRVVVVAQLLTKFHVGRLH